MKEHISIYEGSLETYLGPGYTTREASRDQRKAIGDAFRELHYLMNDFSDVEGRYLALDKLLGEIQAAGEASGHSFTEIDHTANMDLTFDEAIPTDGTYTPELSRFDFQGGKLPPKTSPYERQKEIEARMKRVKAMITKFDLERRSYFDQKVSLYKAAKGIVEEYKKWIYWLDEVDRRSVWVALHGILTTKILEPYRIAGQRELRAQADMENLEPAETWLEFKKLPPL